jgi:hypothetical protein
MDYPAKIPSNPEKQMPLGFLMNPLGGGGIITCTSGKNGQVCFAACPGYVGWNTPGMGGFPAMLLATCAHGVWELEGKEAVMCCCRR